MKKEIVIFADIGLVATYVNFEAHSSEDDYVYLTYVPFDKFPAKRVRYPKPIPRSAIHRLDPMISIKGVADRIVFIYTAEEGSIISDVLETDYKQTIEQLKDRVKSLEMKNASLNQEVEDARAGQKKGIASARSLVRSNQENQSPFGISPIRNRFDTESFDDFD